MKPFLVSITLLFSANLPAAANDIGIDRLSIATPHHEKPIQTALIYPAKGGKHFLFADNAVFYGTSMRKEARPLSGRYPLIVMSHGWGGNYERMAWLAAKLAEKGAIVLSVNHPNSTTRNLKHQTALNHWTRAQDLSAAIDHILIDNAYAPLIDMTRIYAIGFSYGGWTALSMAGAKASRAGFMQYCDAAGEGSEFCTMLKKKGAQITAIDKVKYEASYKDARIKSVAAIDPGLTWSMQQSHVQDIKAKVLLIGLGSGPHRLKATNTGSTGSNFEALLPSATIANISSATHFTALGLCKPAGKAILIEEKDTPVCDDPTGADRGLALNQMVDAITAHFDLKE